MGVEFSGAFRRTLVEFEGVPTIIAPSVVRSKDSEPLDNVVAATSSQCVYV